MLTPDALLSREAGEVSAKPTEGASPPDHPNVATIPLHADFACTLARRLLATTPDPLTLARTLLLLPNRRAARAMTDAFVAESEGRALLLPRMIAVADLDDADAIPGDGLDLAIPPACLPDERRFRLAALLATPGQRPAAALRDAQSLARALDTLQIEERTPADLAAIDVSGLAHHWLKTTARLDVIAHAWPEILAERGLIDPAARRVALAHSAARRWTTHGSEHPVIAAGIANAPPFVAALLRAVAWLANGQVILPGLDLAMAEAAWDLIHPADPSSAAHPQAALKALLEAIGIARAEVIQWDDEPAPQAPRAAAAARALDPASFASTGPPADVVALADIRLLEAASPAEEAQAIALAMREALETPGRTAALVTPDRQLAARVRAHLARWDIDVDDTAGTPLGQTPPGTFLRLLADAAASGFGPVPTLALLKHPFTGDPDRAAHLEATRALDLQLRRAPPPAPGLAALARRVPEDHADWWVGIGNALNAVYPPSAVGREMRPLGSEGALLRREHSLPAHIAALTTAATALAADRPWVGADGRALAEALDLLTQHGAHLPPMPLSEAAVILAATLAQTPVRPPYGGHPRLRILGLLEARLQRADLTILGGLNEGVWPAQPAPDPWLPPLARRQLNLPPLEARIGLAAHDFLAALGSPAVLLTRSRRDATAPTSPSRFLLRLQAAHPLTPAVDLLAWTRALDAPVGPSIPASRPTPAPPAAARPRTIFITQVDTLRADPFAFYASTMLRLRPLDPVGGEITPSERGRFAHKALERWFHEAAADPSRLPEIAAALFDRRYHDQPRLAALWKPRLLRAVGWAAERLTDDAAKGWRPLAVEASGEVTLHGITLKGRADRIDIGPDGALGIVDYKTGIPPSNDQLTAGFATQLGLLGALVGGGATQGVPTASIERLDYWKLGGGFKIPGTHRNALKFRLQGENGDPAPEPPWRTAPEMIAACWDWFDATAERFLLGEHPFTAKLHPEFATGRDYDQLARVDEWQGRA